MPDFSLALIKTLKSSNFRHLPFINQQHILTLRDKYIDFKILQK
ncbi:hypothetical protein PU02_0417 [Bartonella ancashensis]|uniref:Uncharacterized protein n=1 Tax=Bartonella ancashensis TaxID=1318743 RepID=A0A0M3T2Q0_9HYPH|nr:hypothetical protein PU02_0417 [Bartonella ancashensis]